MTKFKEQPWKTGKGLTWDLVNPLKKYELSIFFSLLETQEGSSIFLSLLSKLVKNVSFPF